MAGDCITLKDVAIRADVALDTARRALHGAPSVRAHIRARVLAAAQDLDYQPNLLARALKQNVLRLVPISVEDLDNPYFGSLAAHLSQCLVQLRFEPALCFNAPHLLRLSRTLATSASILVYGFDPAILRALNQRQKVVTVNCPLDALRNVGNVAIAFDRVYRQAAQRLLRNGRRRVAICSHIYLRAAAHRWPQQKFAAVLHELRKAGRKLAGPPESPVFGAAEEVVAWLAVHPGSIDAVFCENDQGAARLLCLLGRQGLRAPDDVQVIGCDANFLLPGMWSVKLDTAVLAAEAVGLLQRLLAGATEVEPYVYRPTLVDDRGQALLPDARSATKGPS